MTFDCTEYGRFMVLHLHGEVDLSNSSLVKKSLLSILEKDQSVIVDFSKLTYIDSSGMATLVEGLNVANSRKQQLYIAGAVGAPLQVLELTRLNQVFNLVPTIGEVQE